MSIYNVLTKSLAIARKICGYLTTRLDATSEMTVPVYMLHRCPLAFLIFQLDVNRFYTAVCLDTRISQFSSNTRLLHPAKWNPNIHVVAAIDPNSW